MRGTQLACLLALASVTAQGAAPRLDALLPPGGRTGSTNTVTALGKFDSWPANLWCNHQGISFSPLETKGKFTVSLDPSVPPGPYLVRMHSKDGASDVRFFVAGNLPEAIEKEDNGSMKDAQIIGELPTVINGTLGRRGDTDFFRISMKKGQSISAQLDAYRMRSLVDPFIRVHDPRGHEVALGSDSHTIDPFVFYEAQETGDHWLQVLAIEHKASTRVGFAGSSSSVYRLTISTNGVTSPGIGFESDTDENRTGNEPQMVKTPSRLAGLLSRPGEIDRYRFAASKDDQLTLRVESDRHGFPMDPVMTIHRPDGKLLREVDDTKPYRDPEYHLKATEGEYAVEISDRFMRGGSDLRYLLVIEKTKPTVSITCEKEIISLEAGKTTDLKLKVIREHGHNATMSISIMGLPKGITLKEGKVAPKDKETTLQLIASAETESFSGPVQILLHEEGSKPEITHKASRSFITDDSRGDYLLNETEFFWMIVKASPPPPKQEKEATDAAKSD